MGYVHMDFESFHALLKLLNKINKRNKCSRVAFSLILKRPLTQLIILFYLARAHGIRRNETKQNKTKQKEV